MRGRLRQKQFVWISTVTEENKGIDKIDGIEVNSKIPEENRRVHFENMI